MKTASIDGFVFRQAVPSKLNIGGKQGGIACKPRTVNLIEKLPCYIRKSKNRQLLDTVQEKKPRETRLCSVRREEYLLDSGRIPRQVFFFFRKGTNSPPHSRLC